MTKGSNTFANQLNLTPKDIDIKYKALEAAKNIKKEAKTQGHNQLKNAWKQKPLYGQ